MPRTLPSNELEVLCTPRWTWRSVCWAGAISVGVYLLLPYLETLSAPPVKTTAVRSVTAARLPPPAPPPPRVPPRDADEKPPAAKPELQPLRRRLAPLRAAMDLRMALGEVGGDFGVDFGMSAQTLEDQVKQLVFEIRDLDEPPRPLARLDPIYPPQARRRKVEGVVVVEFVVAADGSVRDLVVIASQPGDVFTSAAIRAIERWRFTPGTRGEEAVATRVRQRVEFRLD